MRFLVTAPHSFCDPDKPERHCDRSAKLAVDEIVKYDDGRHIRHVQVSDMLRSANHDYNRHNTDNTPWRALLQEKISEIQPTFIFEIHSFPGGHEMYQRLWPSADLAIYESAHNTKWVHILANEIKARVPKEFVILIVQSWHPTAITDDVIAMLKEKDGAQIVHSMFEFNEDMPQERVPVLARAVYDSVLHLVDQNKGRPVFGGSARDYDSAIVHPAALGYVIANKLQPTVKKIFGTIAIIGLIVIAAMIFVYIGYSICAHGWCSCRIDKYDDFLVCKGRVKPIMP